MATPVTRSEMSVVEQRIKGGNIYNRQLRDICRLTGIPINGVKAELQERILKVLQNLFDTGNWASYHRVLSNIDKTLAAPVTNGNSTTPSSNRCRTDVAPPRELPELPVAMPPPPPHHQAHNMYAQRQSGTASMSGLSYKPSPFYRAVKQVGETKVCDAVTQHRTSASISLRSHETASIIQAFKEKDVKVLVFCSDSPSGVQDVAFPHQAELRVNGFDVKANLRGLKNKPGSTRPVDVTARLILQAGHCNTIELVYALTNKKFYLGVYLCRTMPVDQLVAGIAKRRKISKDSVMHEIAYKSQDPDVVATSQVLSLKCPLTYARLVLPCRALTCKHIQCFDASSYLQLQEQGPQWLCPICNKSAPFERLALDEYASEILSKTPAFLDQVTIEPDGKWSVPNTTGDLNDDTNEQSQNDDTEDLVLSEVNSLLERTSGTPSTPFQGSLANPKKSVKRPIAEVVDLTLSSDEDDEPIARPQKRQNPGPGGQGLPSRTNLY